MIYPFFFIQARTEALDKFRREIKTELHFFRVLKGCPNIVQTLFKLENFEAHALELCSHQTLRHFVKPATLASSNLEGGQPENEPESSGRGRDALLPDLGMLLELCVDVARGLAAMHKRGVVHRDLKPDNVLLTRDKETGRLTALIADFGLSFDCKNGIGRANHESGGTPGYYILSDRGTIDSPRKPHPSHDMWSLGCTLFEAAVGKNIYTHTVSATEDKKSHGFSCARTGTQDFMKEIADGKYASQGVSSPLDEDYLSMQCTNGTDVSRDTILCDFEDALRFLNISEGSETTSSRSQEKIQDFSRSFFDLVKSCFERDQTKRPTSKSIFKGLERILDEYRCLEQGEWDTKTSRWAREPANPYRFLRRHLKGTWPDKKVFQRSADRFLEKQQSDMAEAKRLDDLVTVTEPEALVRILEPSDRGSEHPLYTPTANDKKRSHGRSQGRSGKMGVCFSWRDRKWCRLGKTKRCKISSCVAN